MRCFRSMTLGLCATLSGCLLDEAPPPRALQGRTLLAIVAEPAEALPGEPVTYRAIAASPDGPETDLNVAWSFCRTPRPLSENAAVSVACATGAEQPIAVRGLEIEAALPDDACARFGPETSAELRPADPDQSGGYYQPVRAEVDGLVALHRQRVRCALADAPFELTRRFQREYQLNRAPGVQALRVLDASPDRPTTGVPTELVLELAPDAQETYLAYESTEARLIERVERLEVRWFVSAGELQRDQSTPMKNRATVNWTPARAGSAWVWAVVRDERGGVSTWEQEFDVE